jgi:hypothetical protein
MAADDTATKAMDVGRAIGGGDLIGGRGEGPGDVFLACENYKRIANPAARAMHWTIGLVQVKATLLEGDETLGTGGATVPYDTRAGIQPVLFERPTVADLLAVAPTESNKVRVSWRQLPTRAASIPWRRAPRSPMRPWSSMR